LGSWIEGEPTKAEPGLPDDRIIYPQILLEKNGLGKKSTTKPANFEFTAKGTLGSGGFVGRVYHDPALRPSAAAICLRHFG
jgi:hypothetical protein